MDRHQSELVTKKIECEENDIFFGRNLGSSLVGRGIIDFVLEKLTKQVLLKSDWVLDKLTVRTDGQMQGR